MRQSAEPIKRIEKNDFLAISNGLGLGQPVSAQLLKHEPMWQAKGNPQNPFNNAYQYAKKNPNKKLLPENSRPGTHKKLPNNVYKASSSLKSATVSKCPESTEEQGLTRPRSFWRTWRKRMQRLAIRALAFTGDFMVVAILFVSIFWLIGRLGATNFSINSLWHNLQAMPLAPSFGRLVGLAVAGIYVIYLCYVVVFRLIVGETLTQLIFSLMTPRLKTLEDQ